MGNLNSLRDREKTIEWPGTKGFDGAALSDVLDFTSPNSYWTWWVRCDY